MKKRLGTYTLESNRISLNSELARKPPRCLEYVAVYEMTHLIGRHHHERFRIIPDRIMPDWAVRLDRRNRTYLADENWSEIPSFSGAVPR